MVVFPIRQTTIMVLWGVGVLEWFGARSGIDRAQVLRLQEDKAYLITEAQTDLGYAPLAFNVGLDRIYGG